MNTPRYEQMAPEQLANALEENPHHGLPEGWWSWPNTIEAHRHLSRKFLDNLSPYPEGRYAGRGIVICAGGHRLFTNGWVAMRILRLLGCGLPIQFWHLDGEVDEYMADLVRPFQVECINATHVARELPKPPRLLAGWELKPFAILHATFQEVLLLDADNVAIVAPDFLFETPEYLKTGAVFWPDYGRMEPTRAMWAAAEVPYRDEPEVESGQLLVDKSRCWAAINLTMHYNEHSDFYYKHIHGDKCTFQFAWPRTGTPYSMPERGIHSLDATMCQHDFEGRRIFQHRNMDKWRLDGANQSIHDFQMENACRRFLAELRSRWNGRPFQLNGRSATDTMAFDELAGKRVWYDRVGYDSRALELRPDGSIGDGAADCERYWSLHHANGTLVLSILGNDSSTCHLTREGRVWKGAWLRHERMPIEVTLLGLHDGEARNTECG